MLGLGGGVIILPAEVAIRRLLLSYLLAAVSLWSLAALGLLFGVVLEQTASAAMAALGLYFISHIISATGIFTELQRYLPTHHWNWWNRVYGPEIPWHDLLQHGLWIGAYTAACLGLSIGIFLKKDIQS
jgi:ABC-type transport system involved in multi-copper enzyme maturation permease subunit